MAYLYFFGIAHIFLGLPKTKICHYHRNMTNNMTQNSPNMFSTFPMKYFGIPNGRIIYAYEVQGVKMTGSHISPQGLQEYDYN